LIGPTSRPEAEVAVEVADDLERLARAGIELEYHVTGSGPTAVRSHDDVVAAASGVVETAIRLAGAGLDGLIVDCTDDPGVDLASAAVAIPVIGPGAVLRDAATSAPGPVRWWSGDELRSIGAHGASTRELVAAIGDARTVVLGGTGWSHVAEHVRRIDPSLVVIDPLDSALAACIEAIGRGGRTARES
jgi:Asp/Glu/hydantoin racemase